VLTPGSLLCQSPKWVYKDGRTAQWPVEDDALFCKSGTRNIYTEQKSGGAQVHVAPLVNATRPAKQWQDCDIAPRDPEPTRRCAYF
jgi:hypothetical protein